MKNRRVDWGALLTGILLLILILRVCGCSSLPEEGLELEADIHRSVLAYANASDAAVDGLITAYSAEHEARNLLTVEMNIKESTEVVTIGEGDDTLDVPTVDPALVLEIVNQYRDDRNARDVIVNQFRKQWAEAHKNIDNAMRMRAKLREFLESEGVSPEQIEAAADAAVNELLRR